MSCDSPNLQPEHHSDDAALIGACRRLLALDAVPDEIEALRRQYII
jgi:hypothetical protein